MFAIPRSKHLKMTGSLLGVALLSGIGFMARPAYAAPQEKAARDRENAPALKDVVINLDHSIEFMAAQAPDKKGYRRGALDNLEKGRNEVIHELAELEHQNLGQD